MSNDLQKLEAAAVPVEDDQIRTGRDADATRRALVSAARRCFAVDGYRATTVRRIAADAGVNVALINRYFVSKEGLFEACMMRTSDDLSGAAPARNIDEIVENLIAHVVDLPNGEAPLQLLLLIRSSGDENANLIRRRALEGFTQKLARKAGWRVDDDRTAPVLMRAQMAISTVLGVAMLRTSVAAEPIASSSASDLAMLLRQVLRPLLDGTGDDRVG